MGLKRLKQPKIFSDVYKNADGSPREIKLTKNELHHCAYMQGEVNKRFGNALGYEIPITTLTTIVKKVSEQKFYQIAFADYLPVRVGEGMWSSNLTTYRSFDVSDAFESGIINTGTDNDRLSVLISDRGTIDVALNIPVNNWAKQIGWTIFDLEEARESLGIGTWLRPAKERANAIWDLGLQKVAFIGAIGQNGSNGKCLGLLNQATGQFDTTLITTMLSLMTYTQLATFQQASIQAYRKNNNYTAFPTHFIIPEADYNGLVARSSPQFPVKSTLQLLEEGFQVITRNKNFKILPCVYASAANVPSGTLSSSAATGLYTFLNYDEESIRMDIPLDYTNTLANSVDNFMFQNVGYGQFTGALAYRPAELYYAGY